MQIFPDAHYDFIRWHRHAIALSLAVLIAGGVKMFVDGGLPLGIDFSGGTIVIVKFEQPVAEDDLRTALKGIPGDKVIQQFGDRAAHEILIRMPGLVTEEGAGVHENADVVLDTLKASDLGPFELSATEIVGPVVGAELQRRGLYATLGALLGITLYIAFRFRFSFAIGALVAVFHDILVTIAFLIFFGYELSLNVVAAILTITGYSVNDTIVIFDRTRENLRVSRRETLQDVVNTSVNQTLGRTVITSGTTAMAVLALYLFGGEVLRGFAFTMLVGVIAGTYSTVFIAAAIAIILSQRTTPVRRAVSPGQAATPRKANPNVRAS
jgi:preprotein translocase subunit SecF